MGKKKDDNRMLFLISEYENATMTRWNYTQKSWEVFKFYITAITGAGALVLALLTIQPESKQIPNLIIIVTLIIFIIGLIVYLQLLHITTQKRNATKRIKLVRQKAAELISFPEYQEKDDEEERNFGKIEDDYKLSSLFRRSYITAGLKTQLILINSLVGVIAIIAFASQQRVTQLPLLATIGGISFLILVLLHTAIALMRMRI